MRLCLTCLCATVYVCRVYVPLFGWIRSSPWGQKGLFWLVAIVVMMAVVNGSMSDVGFVTCEILALLYRNNLTVVLVQIRKFHRLVLANVGAECKGAGLAVCNDGVEVGSSIVSLCCEMGRGIRDVWDRGSLHPYADWYENRQMEFKGLSIQRWPSSGRIVWLTPESPKLTWKAIVSGEHRGFSGTGCRLRN